MTQRNPMNDRNQREDLGQSRRSAASAKPKAKAHASIRVEGEKKPQQKGLFGQAKKRAQKTAGQKSSSKQDREAQSLYYDPGTPEYKKWRKYWWISIAAALVLTTLSFALQMVLPADFGWVTWVILGLGYALLFFSLWIDFSKVRKIRKEYAEKMSNPKSKAAKREAKARAEAQAAEAAERAARKAARKANRPAFLGGDKKK